MLAARRCRAACRPVAGQPAALGGTRPPAGQQPAPACGGPQLEHLAINPFFQPAEATCRLLRAVVYWNSLKTLLLAYSCYPTLTSDPIALPPALVSAALLAQLPATLPVCLSFQFLDCGGSVDGFQVRGLMRIVVIGCKAMPGAPQTLKCCMQGYTETEQGVPAQSPAACRPALPLPAAAAQ
jgi:hypothetical protein